MPPIGFSTGAIALGDVGQALSLLKHVQTEAIELSALRVNELFLLLDILDELDLSMYTYVAVHAPSKYDSADEGKIVDSLLTIANRGLNIISHPDSIYDYSCWKQFGALLCVENMDIRKQLGQTADDLDEIFERLDEASLCFDIGHAFQVDSSMKVASEIWERFRSRVKQFHVSKVDENSKHKPLEDEDLGVFESILQEIPDDVSIIVESVVKASEIEAELQKLRLLFDAPLQACFGYELTEVNVSSSTFESSRVEGDVRSSYGQLELAM